MRTTPGANRLHIAIFGRRNSGKSSLINALANQPIALVSDMPGTTTDPVFKAMELPGFGPVVFIDTAGIDDSGEVGSMRVARTKELLDQTDLALLIFEDDSDCGIEREWFDSMQKRRIPVIGVINKVDVRYVDIEPLMMAFPIPFVKVSARTRANIGGLLEMIRRTAPTDFEGIPLAAGIVRPGDLVVLVMPQDQQAPRGRLILPQVQTIRAILDSGAHAVSTTLEGVPSLLAGLSRRPDLVIADSRVFKALDMQLDPAIPLTSFSILMARSKGDLSVFVRGARAIDGLKPGDRVLIAEACTHHPRKGDIARDRLPDWLEQRAGGKLDIDVRAGAAWPDELDRYRLIIHCGGCMFTRRQMMSRVLRSAGQDVPITNFGVAIAHLNGMLDRVTAMFRLEQ